MTTYRSGDFAQGTATYPGIYTAQRPAPPCAACSHPENHHTQYGCVTGDENRVTCPCKTTRAQLVAIDNTIQNRKIETPRTCAVAAVSPDTPPRKCRFCDDPANCPRKINTEQEAK